MRNSNRKRGQQFTAEATYYNVSTNCLFTSLVGILLTYYAWQKNGWALLTKSILGVSIFLFILTFILLFSKFSIRKVAINGETLHIGNRSYDKKDIKKIECIRSGRVFHVHIGYLDNSLTLRIKEGYRDLTRAYMKNWCKTFEIPFIEKG